MKSKMLRRKESPRNSKITTKIQPNSEKERQMSIPQAMLAAPVAWSISTRKRFTLHGVETAERCCPLEMKLNPCQRTTSHKIQRRPKELRMLVSGQMMKRVAWVQIELTDSQHYQDQLVTTSSRTIKTFLGTSKLLQPVQKQRCLTVHLMMNSSSTHAMAFGITRKTIEQLK